MNHHNDQVSLRVGRWSDAALTDETEAHLFNYDDGFSEQPVLDEPALTEKVQRTIVVRTGGEERINALLEGSKCRVLIGDAAYHDDGLIKRCADRFGSDRIGIWLPVELFESSWSLDRESNADFNVVAVTNPVPRWNLLDAAGEPRDIDAIPFAKNMVEQGAGHVMLEVANPQDDDLTVCADMSELIGDKLWLSSSENEWDYWVRYAGVRQLVLPEGDLLDLARLETGRINTGHQGDSLEEIA